MSVIHNFFKPLALVSKQCVDFGIIRKDCSALTASVDIHEEICLRNHDGRRLSRFNMSGDHECRYIT